MLTVKHDRDEHASPRSRRTASRRRRGSADRPACPASARRCRRGWQGVTNDPAVSENTNVQPTASPGRLNGKVIRRKVRQAVAPSVRAASSSRGSILPSAEASGSTIIGKKTCSEPMTTAVSEYSSATGVLAMPGREQQPVEDAGRPVAEDQLPAIGPHDDADDQRRDDDHRDDLPQAGRAADHDQRDRIGEHRRHSGRPQADPQRRQQDPRIERRAEKMPVMLEGQRQPDGALRRLGQKAVD